MTDGRLALLKRAERGIITPLPLLPRSYVMQVTLRAETGRERGSRSSRRLRRQGMVPAVVYGRNLQPVAIAVNARELHTVLHSDAGINALINLEIDEGASRLTMARELQRHPVRGEITHLDFVTISLTEKTRVEVAIELTGESEGVLEGGIVETIRSSVEVEALPTEIPQSIVVDITAMAVGDTLRISDLPVIEGAEYLDDPDDPVVTIVVPAAIVAEEAEEGEELEEGEEGEEGEEVEEGEDPGGE
ncbi:MAG TPA: 50S ribosomal protein L25 [Actinobacteria bacterium]|nr:50S ribosomal protein L25 [Actinomycetota bacterium]